MTGFESLIDQKQPLGILSTLLKHKNIPHALLFTGIEGIGKHTAAISFAMACNCAAIASWRLSEQGIHLPVGGKDDKKPVSHFPCGCCRSCKTIQSGSHPDIIWIKPSGSFIKIDQIRTLYQTLAMKPYEAGYRVVIVSDAQQMNPAAGNALLKMLEEPPSRTILILIAQQESDLLPTVVSRCQRIRFHPVSRNALAQELIASEGKSLEEAMIIASMARGSFSRAIYLNRSKWIDRRNWLIKTIGLDSPDFNFNTVKSMNVGLALAAQLSENRDVAEEYLEIIRSWLRDLIIFKYRPEKIIHQDCIKIIKKVSKHFSINVLLRNIKAVESAQFAIRRANANVRLVLDLLVLKLTATAN